MKTAAITTAFSLLFAVGVSALDKPLNIEVTHSTACPKEEQTKKGEIKRWYQLHEDRG